MTTKKLLTVVTLVILVAPLLAACGATPEPQVIKETVEVEKVVTEVVEVEKVVTEVVEKEVTRIVAGTPVVVTTTPEPAVAGPKRGGKLVMAMHGAALEGLDPFNTYDNPTLWVQMNLFDQLFRVAADGQSIEPAAAESYEVSDDGRTYTFRLREGLTFADGTPVTAEDAVFSFELALEGKVFGWIFGMHGVESVEATGEREFQIVLAGPRASFVDSLPLYGASIVPKRLVEEQGEAFWESPVGTGPFVVKEWVRGDHITLEPNPYYWEEGKPYLDEVEIQLVPDDNTRMLKLRAGEVDLALEVPGTQVEEIDQIDGMSVQLASIWNSVDIMMAAGLEPFDDPNVRKALNHATDKQTLIDVALFGYGTPMRNFFPFPDRWPDIPDPYPYDLDLAREYLAQSSVPNGFRVPLSYEAGSFRDEQIATLVQQQWAEIGVEVELDPLESGTLVERVWGGGCSLPTHISYHTSDVIHPFEISILCDWTTLWACTCNEEWQELYDASETMMDRAEHEAAWRELVQIANDWASTVPIVHPQTRTAVADHVKGFKILPAANFRLQDVWLDQ